MEKLLTKQEAGEILGVKVNTLNMWIHYRKIPFIKVNGFVRFKQEHLERWLNRRTYQPVNQVIE